MLDGPQAMKGRSPVAAIPAGTTKSVVPQIIATAAVQTAFTADTRVIGSAPAPVPRTAPLRDNRHEETISARSR